MVFLHNDRPAFSTGSLWANHFYHCGRVWAVIQILRPSAVDGEHKLEIPLENLNLDPKATYSGFDFWEQKPLGLINEKLTVDEPKAFQCKIIALTLLKNNIELIGSSRHVSADIISVKDIKYEGETCTLCLEGIEGESFDYWFMLNKQRGLEIECTGGTVKSEISDCFLKCSVSFRDKDAELIIYRTG